MTRNNDADRNILPDLLNDPIAAAEALVEEFGSARKRLYQCLAEALAIAEVLEEDSQKWAAFQVHVKRRGLHVARTPLRTVMCYLFKAKKVGGPAYDRACCYTRAIEQLRGDHDASASDIAELIREQGGIEELYAKAKAARAPDLADTTSEEDVDDAGDEEDDQILDVPDDTSSDDYPIPSVLNRTGLATVGKVSPPKRVEANGSNEPRKYTKAWCEQRLTLEIPAAKLRMVLNMRDRLRGSIDFVACGKDETGFKIYIAEEVVLR